MTLNALLAMAGRTIRSPREGAAEVMSLGLSRDAVWSAAFLVVILSIILAQLSAWSAGIEGGAPMGPVLVGPFLAFGVYAVALVGTAVAVHAIGRMMGGTGHFPEALLLMAWLQFIMICLQVVQLVIFLLMPPLSMLVAMAGLVLFLWLLTNFIAELHGFRSLAQVFVMMLVSAFGLAFALSIVLTLLGVAVPIEAGAV